MEQQSLPSATQQPDETEIASAPLSVDVTAALEAERCDFSLKMRRNKGKRQMDRLAHHTMKLGDLLRKDYAHSFKIRRMEIEAAENAEQMNESTARALVASMSLLKHMARLLYDMVEDTEEVAGSNICRCPPLTDSCCGHCALNCACWLQDGIVELGADNYTAETCEECRDLVRNEKHDLCS